MRSPTRRATASPKTTLPRLRGARSAARRHRSHASTARGVPGSADARRARSRRDRSNRLVARGGAGASGTAFRSRSAQPRRRRRGGGMSATSASVQHRNRGDVAFGHRKRAGPNRAACRTEDSTSPGANDLIKAQPAHRDQTSPDRFRRRLHQRERRDCADRCRIPHLCDDAHSGDVLRLSLRRLEIDAERTRPPPDQYGVRAVRQIELQATGVLRLTCFVGADRNRRRQRRPTRRQARDAGRRARRRIPRGVVPV